MATMMMWCLSHETYRLVYKDDDMEFDIDWVGEDLCKGPFFTSAPPQDLPDNWQDELDEPSEEELVEINKMSDLLLWDLGLSEK